MMKWTEQQLEAIQTVDKNITVSASAGSGKTTVLVHRLIKRIVDDGISVDRILAMTFTEAAASEMKKRINKELQEKVSVETDAEKLAYLNKQLSLLPSAEISTIHSFCLNILKNYYYVLGQNPDRFSNIFDQRTLKVFEQQALDKSIDLQVAITDNDAFLNLVVTLGSSNDDFRRLKEAIIDVSKQAYNSIDPYIWLDQASSVYQDYTSLKELPLEIRNYFWDIHLGIIDTASYYLDSIKEVAENCENVSSELDTLVLKMEALLSNCKKHIESFDFVSLTSCYLQLSHLDFPAAKKALGETSDSYMSIRKSFGKLIEKTISEKTESERSILKKISEQKPLIQCLVQCTKDYISSYEQIKLENQGIDFHDMEILAIKLLKENNMEISSLLRNKYDEIMVDEFQDSNDIQEALIQLICRNNNVFRVGDIKQSIYGFRKAKPELMRNYINSEDENSKVIFLSNNFRSKQNIVEFNNAVFEKLMNLDRYTSNFSQGDIAYIGIDKQKTDLSNIELDIIALSKDEKNNLNSDKYTDGATKASYIAQKIIKLKQTTMHNKWSDYVVLVRGHSNKSDLKRAFEEFGVPYHLATVSGFFSDYSITIMVSWFNLLLNVENDAALFSILTSPYYHFNDNDLASIKINKGDMSYWEYLRVTKADIVEDYKTLKKMMFNSSIIDVVTSLYKMYDFYLSCTTDKQRDNLDSLYEMALMCSNKDYSFTQFVDYLLKEGTDMGDAIAESEDSNVVRVTTVHSSKGLEFPVVIYWSSPLKKNSRDTIKTDETIGIGMSYVELPKRFVSNTIFTDVITAKKFKSDVEEEIRILYVALTRARDKLVIVDMEKGNKDVNKKITSAYIENTRSIINIIKTIFNEYNGDNFTVNYIDTAWDEEYVNEEEIPSFITQRFKKYNKRIETISTSSPSSLKAMKVYPLLLNRENAALRGNRMHKAMELLSYENYSIEDIDNLPIKFSTSEKQRINGFFEHPMFDEIMSMKIEKEYPFIQRDGNNFINGRIDLVAIGEDEVIVVDFKSDQNVTSEELIDRYTAQMEAYTNALCKVYPNQKITCYIYSFELGEWIKVG